MSPNDAQEQVKRCPKTGNLCLTDTWNLDDPPDCHCGNLVRKVQEPLFKDIDNLLDKIDALECDLMDLEEENDELKSLMGHLDFIRNMEKEMWLVLNGNSDMNIAAFQELFNQYLAKFDKERI